MTDSPSEQAADMPASSAARTLSMMSKATAKPLSSMPRLLYGTAWKAETTADLVQQAFRNGFRGVDTAGQRKHYREDLVGLGIAQARTELGLKREEIWIQTKYTPIDGQDRSGFIPYDSSASISEQVKSSFQHSLKNLLLSPAAASTTAVEKGKERQLDKSSTSEAPTPLPSESGEAYIDSYLLHSPLRTLEQTAEAWAAMEDLVLSGKVRQIGISNCYDPRIWSTLNSLMRKVPCSVLQNRWHSSTGHDVSILPTLSPVLSPNAFPISQDGPPPEGVRYQPFWTLTGNPKLLDSTPVLAAAAERGWTPEQVLYRFVSQGFGIAGVSVTVLCGSTTEKHVKEAVLAVEEGEDLNEQAVEAIRKEIYGQ